ncbi:MAG: hypothetical protein H7831_18025 [Magnetococcus sp. WYHC-3]
MKNSIIHGIGLSVIFLLSYFIMLFTLGYFRVGLIRDFGSFLLFFFSLPQLLYLVPLLMVLRRMEMRRALLGVKIAVVAEFLLNAYLWYYLITTETLG